MPALTTEFKDINIGCNTNHYDVIPSFQWHGGRKTMPGNGLVARFDMFSGRATVPPLRSVQTVLFVLRVHLVRCDCFVLVRAKALPIALSIPWVALLGNYIVYATF